MRIVKLHPKKGYLGSSLWLPKTEVNTQAIKLALTFTPETRGKDETAPRELWKETKDHLGVPREFWSPSDLPYPVLDIRPQQYKRVDIQSHIQLDFLDPTKTTQRDALSALLGSRGGVLQLACGLGKTVISLELIARLQVPALIILENSQLMEQWKGEIAKHLILPDALGQMGGGVFEWDRSLVLATYRTLSNRARVLPEALRRHFGVIIWDEGHHIAATTYSLTADLFYGRRYALTATPERADGMHVLHQVHIGPVIHKNLTQAKRPSVEFYWTGVTPDLDDVSVRDQIQSVTGDTHLMMLASYLAKDKGRIELVVNMLREWQKENRRILVLSYSVAELVNMFCAWSGINSLYSDVNVDDVKPVVEPIELAPERVEEFESKVTRLETLLAQGINAVKASNYQFELDHYKRALASHQSFLQLKKELEKRHRNYIKQVTAKPTAGLLIGKVDPVVRQQMLKTFPVVFAIMKYGVEGLDERSLDTVLALESPSQEGNLRQMMGRALREKAGKQEPLIRFLEDNVDISKGIAANVRRLLRQWPMDQGGPLEYKLLNYPKKVK